MLVILYVISAASSVFSSVYIQKRRLKPLCIATLIAILTGVVFSVTMINKILNNLIELSFWSIFAVFSLIAWHAAFLFNHAERIVDYEFCFVLFAATVCMLYPAVFPTFSWETCNEIHSSTEIVFLITSIDDTTTGETVYGNGFIVTRVYDYPSNSRNSSYHYYYLHEDGTPVEKSIPVHLTTIEYISDDESPYLEITFIRNCSGYDPETGNHSLGFGETTYKLYVHENSIQNVLNTDNN